MLPATLRRRSGQDRGAAGERSAWRRRDGARQSFTARVAGQRYQGTQTVYELEVLGGRLEALELGTSMRHAVGSDVEVVLPPTMCWAYPARKMRGRSSANE